MGAIDFLSPIVKELKSLISSSFIKIGILTIYDSAWEYMHG